jgi:hypothetical protein
VAVLLIHFFACRKPGGTTDKEILSGINNPADCRITKIVQKTPFGEIETGTVSYNSDGNPTAITFDDCRLYRPKIEFRYDAQKRLKHLIAGCDGSNYEIWYQFRHDINGRTIGDTLNRYGRFIDYSVNNPFRAHSYNGYNLPYKMQLSTFHEWPLLYSVYLDKSTITFRCKNDPRL